MTHQTRCRICTHCLYPYEYVNVDGCSPVHFPPLLLSLGRCAQHISVTAALHAFLLRRGRSPSSPPLARFSRFSLTPLASFLASPLSASAPLRTALLAAARLLLSASSLLRLFTRAFRSRSFATPRSLFKEACLACSFCFVHSRTRLFCSRFASLSFRSRFAQLSSALLTPLLFSCLALVSASSVPRLSSLPGSTPLFKS